MVTLFGSRDDNAIKNVEFEVDTKVKWNDQVMGEQLNK